MTDAAALAMGGETLLQLGQLAVDLTSRFANAGSAAPIEVACPNGGTLSLTLLDRDGDDRPSAGDRVSARFRDCGVPLLARVLEGTIDFEVSTASEAPLTALQGTMAFDDGEGLAGGRVQGSGVDWRVRGSLAVTWSQGAPRAALAVASATADDFRILRTGPAGTSTDAYHEIQASKQLDHGQARSLVEMAFHVDSAALGASLRVTTPEPLLAWLNTYPKQGLLELRAADDPAVLRLAPETGRDGATVTVALDSRGDGTADRSVAIGWMTATAGFLWWDGQGPLSWSADPYATRTLADHPLEYAVHVPPVPGPDAPVRLQFSRVPHTLSAVPRWRFRDYGSTTSGDDTRVDVPAAATRDGALMLIRPERQLRHARAYLLEMSLDEGMTWANGNARLTVRDAAGNSTGWAGWLAVVRTADSMLPVPTADATLIVDPANGTGLDATGSRSERPLAGFLWTQVSGPPLVFDNPASPTTAVTLASAHPAVFDEAVVELRITDVQGEVETGTLTLGFLRTQVTGKALYFRSTPGDPVGLGQVGALMGTSVPVGRSFSGITVISALLVIGADDLPLHVGVYENARDVFDRGSGNGLHFSWERRYCSDLVGRFEVLEVENDANGVPIRLALDFEQRCAGGNAPPLFGSVRIDSAIPLRP